MKTEWRTAWAQEAQEAAEADLHTPFLTPREEQAEVQNPEAVAELVSAACEGAAEEAAPLDQVLDSECASSDNDTNAGESNENSDSNETLSERENAGDSSEKAVADDAINEASVDPAVMLAIESADETSIEEPAELNQKWWGPADIHAARGLEDAAPLASLLNFRVVKHGHLSYASTFPWQGDEPQALYKEMGMRNTACSYVAAWLNLGAASMVLMSEVIDEQRLQLCTKQDALTSRLKLLLRPVQTKFPFPVKGAPEADTIGSYFGLQSSSCVQRTSKEGIRHLSLQVDLYSKWQLRLAMRNIGFREGNVLDMLFVDWPGDGAQPAVLASARVTVTDELLQLLG